MIDIKDKIRQSTSSEHDELIGIMKEGLHNEDPKVGIFWYNPQRNELFGVVALSLDDPGVTNLGNIEAYEDKPRGRVFFKDDKFIITVGSWINENDNYRVINLIEETFDLTNEDTEIVIDPHWEIGSGWENL